MKKILFLGCSLWLVSVSIAQQTSNAKTAVGSSASPAKQDTGINYSSTENTLLWEVSGNGLKKPSYLFGTMHLLCSADAKVSENLKKVIMQTDLIYFEIDMDNMMEMLGALRFIKMNGNKKLQDLLTEAEYKRVTECFQKNPSIIPFQMMETYKPYFISSLISEQKMSCDKGGMEQVIMNESRQYKKEIRGLETVEFQASVFDSIPYDQQAKELVKAIDSAGTNSNATEELVAVYKKQDLQKIEELTKEEGGGIGQFIDLLLYNRNANWAQKMSSIMTANSNLFAVGAAHLPGERGVINLLRKSGYTLKPVVN
ncbi:MAG TPA: TraB/GumN family protein [Chitinophagaceae bacterium]|nr:TraB/GumN family protein [Chitinophagaceae bacterium]